MINKELFKTEIEKLFNAHQCVNLVTKEMLSVWYEECKTLKDHDFIIAVNRSMYASRNPRLYDILNSLPLFDKDKHHTIKEYAEIVYRPAKKISNFDY